MPGPAQGLDGVVGDLTHVGVVGGRAADPRGACRPGEWVRQPAASNSWRSAAAASGTSKLIMRWPKPCERVVGERDQLAASSCRDRPRPAPRWRRTSVGYRGVRSTEPCAQGSIRSAIESRCHRVQARARAGTSGSAWASSDIGRRLDVRRPRPPGRPAPGPHRRPPGRRVSLVSQREGFAELSEVRLHYVEAGEGPLVVLLHGFPGVLVQLARPDPGAGRGRLSRRRARHARLQPLLQAGAACRPTACDKLAGDIAELIAERGERSALLVGHDWGAAVAWMTAMYHPQSIERLAILNLPHPRRLLRALRDPRQLVRSWYMFFFQLPWLPERLSRIRNWEGLRRPLERDSHPGAFTAADIERYIEAWSQPGARHRDAQLLPGRLPPDAVDGRGADAADPGSDADHLRRGRPLPAPSAGRALPRRRTQPRAGGAPAGRSRTSSRTTRRTRSTGC